MNREDANKLAIELSDYVYKRRNEVFHEIAPIGIPEDNYVIVLSQKAKSALILCDYSTYGLTNDPDTHTFTKETMMGFPVKDHPYPRSLQHVILCSKDDWRAIEGEWKV